jgi:pimeloyl-ACP methyl ester carboxylesterase
LIHDPDTHYARTADGAHLAFQVVGDGPHDLILMLNTIPIDSVWEDPDLGGAVESLARSTRVVLFDARGAGASDALPQGRLLAVEEAMSDIATVMDAAGSRRAFLFKTDNIAPVVMFATTWPERVGGIVMLNAYARLGYAADYPMGIRKEQLSLFVEVAQTGEAGADAAFRAWCRPRMNDERLRRWFRKAYRRTAAPRALVPLILQDFETDARHVLPLVQVPTLVLHCADDPYIVASHGQYLAKHITGARYAELPGDAHSLASVDLDPLVDEVSEFVTGAPTRRRVDRVLATVLFTDIVDSTAHAVRMGDARWKALLDEHDAVAQRQTSRFGGRLIKSTGDGVVEIGRAHV